jgi:hypothetical protein
MKRSHTVGIPSGRFRDVDTLDRPRFVGAFKQLGAKRRPVVLQMLRQGLNGHAVDSRRSLVAPDLRQRFPQIVAIDNRFHAQSGHGRRAFGVGARRTGFGPSPRALAGFTRSRRRKGQFELDFRPHGQCENSVLLAPSTVRAFASGQPLSYYALG